MSKSSSQISILLDSLNAEVTLYRSTYSYEKSRWACTIAVSTKGTELKVRAEGDSCEEVFVMAFDKLESMIEVPVVANALAIPLLSPPVESDPQF